MASRVASDSDGGGGSSSSSEEEDDDLLAGVDWSAGASAAPEAVNGSSGNNHRDVVAIAEDAANDEADAGGREPKRRKVSAKRRSRKRRRAELVHRMGLLCGLARALRRSSECDSACPAAASLMPEPFLRVESCKRLRLFVAWFAQTFSAGEAHRSLEQALEARGGSAAQLTQGFVALSRSAGVPCRLVVALKPKARVKGARESKAPARAAGGALLHLWAEVLVLPRLPGQSGGAGAAAADAIDIDADGAVADDGDKEERWVHVDPALGKVDSPPKFGTDVPYVVAIGAGGFALDVTARYAQRWSATAKLRVKDKEGWWKFGTLMPCQNGAREWVRSEPTLSAQQRATFGYAMSEHVLNREDQRLESQQAAEKMPTSLDGFRRHKSLVLSKLLGRNEGTVPSAKPVGLFKGDTVFRREDVEQLWSKTQWRQRARVVLDEELTRPAKRVVPRKGRQQTFSAATRELDKEDQEAAAKDGNKAEAGTGEGAVGEEGEGEDEEAEADGEAAPMAGDGKINLYGSWQTKAFVAPEIGSDGAIPKSEYGNYELWSSAHLPRGAEHVQDRFADRAARQMGIDFAPALVGFERRDGRQLPRFDGIIVAAASAQLVREGAAAIEQEAIRKQIIKRQERAVARWEKLAKAVLIADRLASQYGSQEAAAAADEQQEIQQLSNRHQSCSHDFAATGERRGEDAVVKRCKLCGFEKVVEEL